MPNLEPLDEPDGFAAFAAFQSAGRKVAHAQVRAILASRILQRLVLRRLRALWCLDLLEQRHPESKPELLLSLEIDCAEDHITDTEDESARRGESVSFDKTSRHPKSRMRKLLT